MAIDLLTRAVTGAASCGDYSSTLVDPNNLDPVAVEVRRATQEQVLEGGCFVAGTLVTLSDGHQRAIETTRGDQVLSSSDGTRAKWSML